MYSRVSTLLTVSLVTVLASACTKEESTTSPGKAGDGDDSGVGPASGGGDADAGAGGASAGGRGGATAAGGKTGTKDDGGNVVGTDGGDGTGDSGTPQATGGDPCGSVEAVPNEDREHPTPYTLGTEFDGCLQTDKDTDFYEYTVPTTPAQGGYVSVYITEVGTKGSVDSEVQGADNGRILEAYGPAGTSVFFWYAAKAGAKFRFRVFPWVGSDVAVPYTMRLTYTGVPDVNAPNDTKASAKTISEGAAVKGYFFAGYENSTAIPETQWDDWYKITLKAGRARFAVTDVPADVTGMVNVYDSLGTQVDSDYNPTDGSSVVLDTTTALAAGDYYVRVHPWLYSAARDEGSNPAPFLTEPYTLTVSVTP